MSTQEDYKVEIDALIEKVTEKRKSGLTILQMLDRYSRYAAQIVIDKEPLMQTGYPWPTAERDIALFTVLTDVHAERVAAEGKDSRSIRRKAMEKMHMYHEFLNLIVEHVIDETNDENVKAAHAKIKKGESHVDTLHDIIAMTKILREYQEVAITYTPCGIVANEGYLDIVSKEAQELLKQIGIPVKSNSERSHLVDKQEKVITLCMEAVDRIKKYAKGAFAMNKPYYRKYYTLNDFHRNGSDTLEVKDVETDSDIGDDILPETDA